MIDKKRPLDGGRLVEIDFASVFGRNVARILIIRVLRDHGYLSGRKTVQYFIDDSGFSGTSAAGYADN